MMTLRIVVLFTASHLAAAGFMRGAQLPMSPDPKGLQVESCSCGCCHTTYRTPDEMEQGGTVFLKCALDEVQSKGTAVQTHKDLNGKITTDGLSCRSSCMKKKDNSEAANKKAANTTSAAGALAGMAGPGEDLDTPIDYNRYCFYNCRPYDFTIGNICVGLSRGQDKVLKGEVDPAMHPQVTDPNLQKAWAQATGNAPVPTEPPPVTTPPLPCHKSDPCAYKLMNQSIKDAKVYYSKTVEKANKVAEIAKKPPAKK